MAITKIKKISIFSHNVIRDALLEMVQHLGTIDIIDIRDVASKIDRTDYLKRKEAVSLKLSKIDEVIKILHTYEPDKGILESLVSDKVELSGEEFMSIDEKVDFDTIYEKFLRLKNLLKDIELGKEKIADIRIRFAPWKTLSFIPSAKKDLKYTHINYGMIHENDYPRLSQELTASNYCTCVEEVSRDKEMHYLIVSFLKNDKKTLNEILNKCNFNEVQLETKMTIKDDLLEQQAQYLNIIAEEATVLADMGDLLVYKSRLMCLHDHYLNIKNRLESEENFVNTKKTCMIEGWIRQRDIAVTKKNLSTTFSQCEMIVRDPDPKEKIPVDLENNRILKPFEFVTGTYGVPKYGEVDPTPFLAPFFFVFFGFCITDMAYGIILTLVCWWGWSKVRKKGILKKFLMLLVFCGISTTVIGFLAGGFFGNLIVILAENYPALFDPLVKVQKHFTLLDLNEDPMTLLVIALCLGMIQLVVGHLIAFFNNVRKRKMLDGIMDQLSILIFMAGFTGCILIVLEILNKKHYSLFSTMLIIGCLSIVFTAGRSFSGIGAKLFNGFFILYQIVSGFISDVLSYSRLWALGMVTGVMAMTCNVIAFMFGSMIPLVGFVFTIIILLGGHVFTLAINVLSALIHSGRLQYVEFFPKFFIGGGKQFKPFQVQNRYTFITNNSKK
ncbi:MAG: V-type ATP synthase subunit I [Candidatus Ancaeobacter aquaticus]|nr:V-type ATP synthase subunit I [Candidatus Ancaeobacter aquaticus]